MSGQMGKRDMAFISDSPGDDVVATNPYFFEFLRGKHIRTFFAHYGRVRESYREFFRSEPSEREVRDMKIMVFTNRVVDAVVNDSLYLPRKFLMWHWNEDREPQCC